MVGGTVHGQWTRWVGGYLIGLTDDLTSLIVSYSRANSVVRGGCYGARNAL